MFGRNKKNNKVVKAIDSATTNIPTVTQPEANFGDDLVKKMRDFNIFRDRFMLEASSLLLMVGFVMGTLNVFIRGDLAGIPFFNISWALVQALSIDGLFFVIWARVGMAQWKREYWLKNTSLVFVGCLLGLTVAIVNDVVTFQELNSITDSVTALRQLQIDVATFTHARAVLVVVVGILIVFILAKERAANRIVGGNALPVETTIVPTTIAAIEPTTEPTNDAPIQVTTVTPTQAIDTATTNPKLLDRPAVITSIMTKPVDATKTAIVWELFATNPKTRDATIASRAGCTIQYVGQQRRLFNMLKNK